MAFARLSSSSSSTPPVCRAMCAACCIAPSISTPIPQPDGRPPQPKPAGVPCVQLDEHLRCRLFGRPARPAVCGSLQPEAEMCGTDRVHALHWLEKLEAMTSATPRPGTPS